MSRVKHICYAKTKNNKKCKNRVSSYNERCHLHSNIEIKRYYGFYPYPNYLLDNRLEEINQTNKINKDMISILKDSKIHFIENEYELIIRNDGMVLISVSSVNEKIKDIYNLDYMYHSFTEPWSNYIEIINILYLLYDIALISNTCNMSYKVYEFYELKKHDIFRVTYENGEPISSVCYGNENKIRLATYNKLKNVDKFDFNITSFDNRKFSFLNDYLKEILSNEKLFNTISLFTKSISEYHLSNYNSSFILNWFYLESYFTNKWMDYINSININIEQNKPRFNSNRRKKLKKYTIDNIIEQLEVNSIITFEEYEKLNELRKIRNDIIHDLSFKSTSSNSAEIIKFITTILNNEFNLDWTLVSGSHCQHGM